ncbi:MAG: transketolase [Treponema sp. GWB1_62_6]|nr:MAG: transketolase [Treponema sp. GWA1_62_8]OHE65817.1 MAG: transketolase [Treponema sp. GWC1_61_84]OHE71896.1 MAG: transketolase [Treponema sp. RIFOXYC1_FULL_61_9]OHE72206.1 MAG: transketolase [Treponema sp. GWB1_62_6]HCM28629.1 transketolase [Treponema sp.]
MADSARIRKLEEQARQLRRDVVDMVHKSGDGHPSPSMSVADIVTAMYFDVLRIDPSRPEWMDRDRFVLSKGHACPVLYAALARRGYFGIEELPTLRSIHSNLQGHPYAPKTRGLDATTGSLGNGVSVAIGMALAARMQERDYRVYAVTGDGELGEGLIWEAAMCAGHQKLANLTVFVDNNNYQSGGTVGEVSGVYPIKEKWEAFGWTCRMIDGHDMGQILDAVDSARKEKERPSAIIAKTVKGQGVSFMIGDNSWHKRIFTDAEYASAMKELGGSK